MGMTLYTDGGSRGNPGEAASAFVIVDESGKALKSGARRIGVATNNEAEYAALIDGLRAAAGLTSGEVLCVSDSKLLVSQMRGEYRIREPRLRGMAFRARDMQKAFRKVTYRHVPRSNEWISKADRMVNLALDHRGAR
jgi:ribonuclease HI